jgi:hypothetical protein
VGQAKVAKQCGKLQGEHHKQAQRQAVLDAKDHQEQQLEAAVKQKAAALQHKCDLHNKSLEQRQGHTEAAVAAVLERKNKQAATIREQRDQGDQMIQNRTELIAQYNTEQAHWLRESTKQGISVRARCAVLAGDTGCSFHNKRGCSK